MWLLSAIAFAREPLLYTGDLERAVRIVSEGAGVPPWELEPIPFGQLSANVATVVGAPLERCTDYQGSSQKMADLVSSAVNKIAYREFSAARIQVDLALKELRCLKQPVEPLQGALLFEVLGNVTTAEGHPEQAANAYKRALDFLPNRGYDPQLPADGRAVFDKTAAQRMAMEPVSLRVIGTQSWLVDGAVAQPGADGLLKLSPGEHLFQVLSPTFDTFRVTLSGSATLLLPGAGAAVPTTPEPTWALLAMARVPAATHLYAVTDNGAWAYGGSLTDWTVIPQRNEQARLRLATGLIAGGGTALVLGGVTAFAALESTKDNPATIGADNPFLSARLFAERSNALGWAVAGLGAASLVGGTLLATIHPQPLQVTAAPQQGGAMVIATWTPGETP